MRYMLIRQWVENTIKPICEQYNVPIEQQQILVSDLIDVFDYVNLEEKGDAL